MPWTETAIVLLILFTNVVNLLHKTHFYDPGSTVSEQFRKAKIHADASSRHLVATSFSFGDPHLIPQQGMIQKWPQLWGWNRVPPKRMMNIIEMMDPGLIGYESGKISRMRFVYNHFDGSLIREENMPLLDLMNLEYVLVHNMPVRRASPYYIAWLLRPKEYLALRTGEDWRNLSADRGDISFHHGGTGYGFLDLGLAWDGCKGTVPAEGIKVTVKKKGGILVSGDLDMECGPGPGRTPRLKVEMPQKEGRITVSVSLPTDARISGLRFERPALLDSSKLFQSVYRNEYLDLYRNTEALPQAFLLYSTVYFEDREDILSALDKADRRELAGKAFLMKDEAQRYGGERRKMDFAGKGRIKEKNTPPGRREFSTQIASPAFLFISQNLLPGWRAFVDGKERPLLHAYWTFTGLFLEPGDREVVLTYRPVSFRIALWTFITAAIFTAGMLIYACYLARPAKKAGR